MVEKPRSVDEIYDSLKSDLQGKIRGLTNFTETSFNFIWTQAFSERVREVEVDTLDAQLAGWIDYAGGPITEDDLDELDIEDSISVSDLSQQDEYLDELVKIVGVTRDQGAAAVGQVTFTTQSASTNIPAGTTVATQPDADGDTLEFDTDEAVSTGSGETTVTAAITATDVGDEYNVGAGTITRLVSPPVGVQSVVNNSSTSGGEDVETNDELRERAKDSVFNNSGGGTVEGIIGYIENGVDGVDEVQVEEFFTGDSWHGSYPHAHVIVDAPGVADADIETAIDEARPVAVAHFLVEPEAFDIRVDITVEGTDISTSNIEENVAEYIDDLELGEELIDVQIIQEIMNADPDVEDIPVLLFFIEGELEFFDDSVDVYNLGKGSLMEDDGIESVTGTLDGTPGHEFAEDVDFQEWNSSAGNTTTPHDSIDWSPADTSYTVEAVADDGGVQTTETTAANNATTNDMTLLPATPAVDDAYYFGHDDPFTSMLLNVSTAGSHDLALTWEYYNGTDWSEFQTVVDNTNEFTVAGSNYILFSLPESWETTSVNGIGSQYWIRARVDTFSSQTTQPLGQEVDIGFKPDTVTGETVTLTFDDSTDEYFVDEALLTDGITDVTDAGGTTYTEDTDYQEIDVRADGIINGIDWSIAGSTPSDEEEFTVTYDAGTSFDVTYELADSPDISFEIDEKAEDGNINITVA